jgi:mRNA interferase RelE/StbE
MYEIQISDKAKKQLSKLPKNLQNRIGSSFEKIKIRPYHFVKRLVGTNYFSLRVGEYRIILDINNSILEILVIEIGHRRNIYK